MKGCVYLLLILAIFASGCSSDIESPSSQSDLYTLNTWYPSDTGFWREYAVDSSFYSLEPGDSIVKSRSVRVYLKETIVDTVFTGTVPALRVLLEQRSTLSDPYRFLRYHSLVISSTFVIRNEDNLQIVPLQAPIRASTTWKGNRMVDTSQFPDFAAWDYQYASLNTPMSIGTIPFDTTATVMHIADSNAIEKKLVYEQYAKRIGMIYSERSFLYKQNGANPWSMPENGYTIRKQIINWRR